MIRSNLLEILCCPDTRKPLRIADASLVHVVNQRIKAGDCKNRAGEKVSEVLQEALVTEDGVVLYPVRKNIPILLINEGIRTAG